MMAGAREDGRESQRPTFYTESIGLKLKDGTRERLDAAAAAVGQNRSRFVRRLVMAGLLRTEAELGGVRVAGDDALRCDVCGRALPFDSTPDHVFGSAQLDLS